MPGLTGASTARVGADLVSYLQEVARFFGVSIHVTSGYRSPDGQARAMFDNWAKMKHGRIYKTSTLPANDREALDVDWTTAHDRSASAAARSQAEAAFLERARTVVGSKSMHTQGRAIDVRRLGITSAIYHAIVLHLNEVKEGTRTDIYHFESRNAVPAVDDALRAQWQALRDGSKRSPKPRVAAVGNGPC